MMCETCHSAIRPGAAFCGECGTKVPVAAAPLLAPPPPPPTTDAEVPIGLALGSVDMIAAPPGIFAAPLVVPGPPPPPPPPPPAPADVAIPVTAAPPVFTQPDPEPETDATQVSVRRRAGSRWRLVLPDGQHFSVEKSVLVGRGAAANAHWPDAALLSVTDSTKSVSKTHAVLELDKDGLWVTDLDSTNGVVVRMPDGTEHEPASGERVGLLPGSDVELGDFVIQIEKD